MDETDKSKSNPKQFQDFLKKIRFSDADLLEEALYSDYMFDHPESAKFLGWLFSNVSLTNMVTEDEQKRYDQLVRDGGALDEEALKHVRQEDAHVFSSEEDMLHEIERMAKLNEQLDHSNRRLQQISTSLDSHEETRVKTQLGLESSFKRLDSSLDEEEAKCNVNYGQFDAALADLSKCMKNICVNLEVESTKTSLVNQMDLQEVFNSERKFSKSLAAFTNEKFFQGQDITGGDNSECKVIDLRDPVSLSSSSSPILIDRARDVVRLQQSYARNTVVRASTVAQLEGSAAGEDFLNNVKGDVDRYTRLSEDQLRSQIGSFRDRLTVTQQELTVVNEQLSQLSEQAASYKEAYILSGDYNLKLSRQQYFLDAQQEVLSVCIEQRARMELISLILEIEIEELDQLRSSFTAVVTYLTDLEDSTLQRANVIDEGKMYADRFNRNVIDSRELQYESLTKIFENRSSSAPRSGKLFSTYQELSEHSQLLATQLEQARAAQSQDQATFKDTVDNMRKVVSGLVEITLPPAGSDSSLTPPLIVERLSEISELREKVKQEILHILTFINKKRKLMTAGGAEVTTSEAVQGS